MLELLAPIQIQIRELPAEVDSVSETATNGPAFALPFQGQETGAKTVSPNTASRSRALNRCAQSSRSTAFENTHPAVCSADLASSRNTASISTPQTSQTLPLEVPARVPHKKDDQDSTQPHRVESIKSLGNFSFSSSSTCDAILHRHRMSLQRNIATEYDFFNGLLGLRIRFLHAQKRRVVYLVLFFTLNREDFSFVIHLDRQPRTSRRREAQTGSRARSGSRSERTLDAVEHSRTLMEWWPFLIFHRGGLRIKVINNTWSWQGVDSTQENASRQGQGCYHPMANLRSE